MILEYCKLQIGCFLIVCYIIFLYITEKVKDKKPHKKGLSIYEMLMVVSLIEIVFDGATAYTVNNIDSVGMHLNRIFHLLFLLSLDGVIFFEFLHVLSITEGLPKKKRGKVLVYAPFVVSMLIILAFIVKLEYEQGYLTNYSMGISAYACFVMVGIYGLVSVGILIHRIKYIESHKRISIFTCLLSAVAVTLFQMFVPEALCSSLAVTFFIIGIYLNNENPAIKRLKYYRHEMIMGFATLVENRDESTGGHIKRTTQYVNLIAEEMRNRGLHTDVITRDFLNYMDMSAPMHDIGKIAIPDQILKKPGKLTAQEFEIMKTHAAVGGDIILESFDYLEDKKYEETAYQVARYHHEKWNGKGYPEGLSGTDIPFCARIMAVADVFDAVSAKRCYRGALPLDKCFDIIKKGSGEDFDPEIADLFLDIRGEVEHIYLDGKDLEATP